MSETGRMQAWVLPIRSVFVCLAALGCGCLGSCVSMDTTSVEDRIEAPGPGPRARTGATQPGISFAATQPAPTQTATTQSGSAPAGSGAAFIATVEDAIFGALDNNRSLAVERLNPPITRTAEQVALAAFDPVVNGSTSYRRSRTNQVPSQGASRAANASQFSSRR